MAQKRVRIRNVKSAGMYAGRQGVRIDPAPGGPPLPEGLRGKVQVLLDGQAAAQLFDPSEVQDL